MKRFSEQFKKPADRIKLRAVERHELRERLQSYMEYHPLPAHMRTKTAKTKTATTIESQPFIAVPINWTWVRGITGSLAVMVLIVVPFMAERTVPGDVLYKVKTQFNEEVRASLAFSPYAKVEWETTRLERRIAEARVLASEGKLTNAVQNEVAAAVQAHNEKAKAEIAELRESDADEAAIAEIAFASALAVQNEVLEETVALGETATATESTVAVAVLADVVAGVHQDAETAQAGNTPSYERLLAHLELETTRAEELFASINGLASEEEKADVKRRLADIERKVAEAIEAHAVPAPEVTEEVVEPVLETVASSSAASTTPEAVVVEEAVAPAPVADPIELLRAALTDVRKLMAFMTDIDVREAISIEELVPVTPTEAELQRTVEETLEAVATLTAEAESGVVIAGGEEKYAIAQAEIVSAVARATSSLAVPDYGAAQAAADEALAYARDIVRLTTRDDRVAPAEPVATSTPEAATSTEEIVPEQVEEEVTTDEA